MVTDVQSVIAAVRGLGPDAIRERLSQIDAERRTLMILLRAAIRAAGDGTPQTGKGSKP